MFSTQFCRSDELKLSEASAIWAELLGRGRSGDAHQLKGNNTGAIFRSAAGLGVDAVLLTPTCCDPLYRRAVRVSMGEVFALPYAYLDWPDGLDTLRAAGFQVLALTPAPDATRLEDVVLADEDRAALLLGAEGPGLTDTAMQGSDLRVRIPMTRGVDSLNVANAAAVACWVVGRRPV